ncbi:MAG: hypothetical protein E6G75_03675 [Alphaproteobacteria bacterium]|nr:MAG: hypothetical protein E6G75_03675 [Alphaproteobacteria bacterium]
MRRFEHRLVGRVQRPSLGQERRARDISTSGALDAERLGHSRVQPPATSAGVSLPDASSYVPRSRYSAPVRRTKRETDMPEIYVHAVKGRSLDQKRALIKDITDAVVKNFSVPAEAVMVEIVESEPTAKAKGGVLFSEMRR